INTGAPIPPGADAVVRVEDTEVSADRRSVTIRVTVAEGQSICRRGAYVRAGDAVLEPGDRFGPGELAVAATAGATRVKVHGAACVAVLVTGDELVSAAQKPVGGQIRDSNGPMLEALLAAEGAEVTDLGRAGDERGVLTEKVQHGLDHDVLCLTGGVSMGAFDFVPEVLAACGVRIHFQKMRTKPGRPTLFGTTEAGTLVFGLPGNPVSALVGYTLLVQPAIAGLHGRVAWPRVRPAVLEGAVGRTGERTSFSPAAVTFGEDGRLVAAPRTWYGSGDPFGLRRANGFIVRPPQSPDAAPGEVVEVLITRWQDAG
ncbi:MAG TPA: molybdopterin molybdotransferase MoeA, partial [Phycisphaerae bacterium]|nr:molybdopterin molybdotransferase MoeA [Phycisphaerae bacterium]